MVIVTADASAADLKVLNEAVAEACPDAEVHSFQNPKEVLKYAARHECHAVFLDIPFDGMNGIELAEQIKIYWPETNFIFTARDKDHAWDAFRLRASGYLMKPVDPEQIREELEHLRYPLSVKKNILKVKCFGNFEVLAQNGEAVRFERTKAKEVLAYLIHRKGNSCTIREIAGVLFEEMVYDRTRQAYVQTIIASLNKTLKKYGAQEVLIKGYNSLAVNPRLVECDYYKFLDGDPESIRAYMGEYMAEYYWGEFVVGYLDRKAELY